MTEPRRVFQLHLPTALVLMVLAAGLLGANLTPREHNYGLSGSANISGWPWTHFVHSVNSAKTTFPEMLLLRDPSDATRSSKEYQIVAEKLYGPLYMDLMGVHSNWQARLFGNIFVALAILTLAAVLLEWRLRRKTDPKEEAAHG